MPDPNLITTAKARIIPRLPLVMTSIDVNIDHVLVHDRHPAHITAPQMKATRQHHRHDMIINPPGRLHEAGILMVMVGIIGTTTQALADWHPSMW
jgi:hypothetical protein